MTTSKRTLVCVRWRFNSSTDDAFLTILGDAAATGPTNCILFGSGDFGPYKGFVYSGEMQEKLSSCNEV